MGLRCLYSYALFRFYQTPPLWSHLSKGHFSWYVCSGGTLLTWAMQPNSFYKEETFTWQPFQANPICHFLTALLWTLIFIIITEACRVWYVAIALSIARSDLGENLLRCQLLGRLDTPHQQNAKMSAFIKILGIADNLKSNKSVVLLPLGEFDWYLPS